MRQLGYSLDKLRALRGGSIAWEELGLPIVDAAGKPVE
jgi:hypothetical protein